ncbi:MAG: CBS domain-containing protein [Planctomycetota bacterium]
MTTDTACCLVTDNLAHAASRLWQKDCGSMPVVDEGNHVRGMITDRDICMAAFVTGKPLADLNVGDSMAKDVSGIGPDDSLLAAEMLMRSRGVHRLPVVDPDGQLLGMLCCNDLLRWVDDGGSLGTKPSDAVRLVRTLAAIGRPRSSVPVEPVDGTVKPPVPARAVEPQSSSAVGVKP